MADNTNVEKISSKFEWDTKKVIWEVQDILLAVGDPSEPEPLNAENDHGPQEYKALLDIDFMNSLQFSVGTRLGNVSTWSLTLSKNQYHTHLCLSILLNDMWFQQACDNDSNLMDGVYMKYKMGVINAEGEIVKEIDNKGVVTIRPGYSWVEDEFLLVSDLWNPSLKLLNGDKLKIYLDISVFSQLKHTSKIGNSGDVPFLEDQNSVKPFQANNVLKQLWMSRDFADVTIRCEGKISFKVHKCVIAAASPVFRTMFTISMSEASDNEVEIPEVDAFTVEAFFRWIYCGELGGNWTWIPMDKATGLIHLAEKYEIRDLKTFVFTSLCALIEKQTLKSPSAVGMVLVFANMYRAHQETLQFLHRCIIQNLKQFRSDPSFCSLVNDNPSVFAPLLLSNHGDF